MVPPSGDDRNADDHTQLFDSCCSPSLSAAGNGFGQCLEPFDDRDHVPGENVNETQVLPLAGETQVFDYVPAEDVSEIQVLTLAGETQVFDYVPAGNVTETQVLTLAGETQVFDGSGETQVLDNGGFPETTNTQVLGKFDDVIASDREGHDSDGTEVIYDTDQLSDAEHSTEGCQFLGETNIQGTSPCNQSNNDRSGDYITSLVSEEKITGHAPRFTSVRVASLRAFGLAAGDLSAHGTHRKSSSLVIEPLIYKNGVGQIHDPETDDGKLKRLDNLDDGRTGSMTARFFYENLSLGHQGFSQDTKIFDEGECLAGLSYVDSQEPGELSQANALNFVERLINDNLSEYNTENDHVNSAQTKSKTFSSTKGLQSLASRNAEGDNVGRPEIFDWDDDHEDDGGGDFFVRMREDLIGEARGLYGPKRKRVGEHMGMYKQSDDSGKRVVDSPVSKLMLQKLEGESKSFQEIHHLSDCTKEFNKELSVDPLKATSRMNAMEISDVGCDTQMAAEAMEVLSFGLDVVNDNTINVQEADIVEPCVSTEASQRGKNACFRRSVSKVGLHDPEPEVNPSKGRFRKTKKICTRSSRGFAATPTTCPADVKEYGIGLQDRKIKVTGKDATEDRYFANIQPSGGSNAKGRQSTDAKVESMRLSHNEDSSVKFTTRRYAKRKRSSRKHADNASKCGHSDDLYEPSTSSNDTQQAFNVPRKSRSNVKNIRNDLSMRKFSECAKFFSLINGNVEGSGIFPHQSNEYQFSRVGATCIGESAKGNLVYLKSNGSENHTGGGQVGFSVIGESLAANRNTDSPMQQTSEQSPLLSTTPVSCVLSPKQASSISTKDEHFKRSCRKNLSQSFLVRELFVLSPMEQESISPSKDRRKRRNLTEVRVLLSQHLDEDIIRQQQKIMVRLGISEVSTIADATHFITDNFMRTRNMLEAIASGKLVVTHLWLESVGQVNIHIDEEPYILRDIKKEKEFGFCMPLSLERARKCPLLQGRNVLITPNVKPSKDTISRLVKAVHGQALDGTDISALKGDKILDDLLILSCEEDYRVCVPLLGKGSPAYSSELLLNGIVAQKLEYERYRLFKEHAKRRR